MKESRIAGPYDPLYADVTGMLRANVKSYLARWIYFAMVSFFYVEEEWGDDPVWAHGIVRAKNTDIARESGVARGSFYRGLQELVDAGKSVTIQPSFIDGKREIEFVVCSRVEKFSGDWIRCIQLTIPEAILNLKVEE